MSDPQLHITKLAQTWDAGEEVFNLLVEFLNPSSRTTPRMVADRVNGLYPAHGSGEDSEKKKLGEVFLWKLWDLVLGLVRQLHFDSPAQEKMAEFVKTLRGIPCSSTLDKVKLWGDLPNLGLCVWEAVNDMIYIRYTGPDYQPSSYEKPKEQVNFYAFLARLTRSSTYDFSKWAIADLREALENEPDHRARAYHEQGSVLDSKVPIAVNWISLAGQKLFESNEAFQSEMATGGRLWKRGKKGFCRERWDLWKRRFREVSQLDQASEKTRELADQAVKVMDNIDGSNTSVSGI